MRNLRTIAICLLLLGVIAYAWNQAYKRGKHDADDDHARAWAALIDAGRLDGYMNWIDRFTPEGMTIQQSEAIAKDYRLQYQKFVEDIGKLPDQLPIRPLLGVRLTNLLKPDDFDAELRDPLEFASAGMLSGDELAAKAEAAYKAASDGDLSQLIVWHEEYDLIMKQTSRNHPTMSMKQTWMMITRNQMKAGGSRINHARFFPLDQLPERWSVSESATKEPLLGYVIITYGPEEMAWTTWPVVQTRYGARLLAWQDKPEWHVTPLRR